MRRAKILLTVALLALGWGGATPVTAKAQLGDLIKKVAGKDSTKDQSRGKSNKPAAGERESKAKAEGKDSVESSGSRATGSREKVDRFIDRNNDGIDDRRQSKVKREEPRSAPAATEKRARPEPPAAKPDSTRSRPPG